MKVYIFDYLDNELIYDIHISYGISIESTQHCDDNGLWQFIDVKNVSREVSDLRENREKYEKKERKNWKIMVELEIRRLDWMGV